MLTAGRIEAGVGGLGEEGGLAAVQAEDGDGKAEGLLEGGQGAGGEQGGGGPVDGILEEDGSLDVSDPVDDVVQHTELHPFQPDFREVANSLALPLGEEVRVGCWFGREESARGAIWERGRGLLGFWVFLAFDLILVEKGGGGNSKQAHHFDLGLLYLQ